MGQAESQAETRDAARRDDDSMLGSLSKQLGISEDLSAHFGTPHEQRRSRVARPAPKGRVKFNSEVDLDGVYADIDEQELVQQRRTSGVPRVKKTKKSKASAAEREWKSAEIEQWKEMMARGIRVRFHDEVTTKVFRTTLTLELGYVLKVSGI